MNVKFLSILPLVFIFPFVMMDDDENSDPHEVVPTGIILDTLNNEVKLMMEKDQPQYYFANIFTPVCNTGECLPVKINLYWDLTGKYLKFDQPEGEILTKLDHEPFTEDDYDLLDEILRGSDPRFAGQVKHHKMERNADESSPAPENVRVLGKYEMVDGITGSTLPEVKDKFVPGALYTTYTIWGLANDHQNKIRKYTEENLLIDKHIPYILSQNNYQYNDMVIYHLASKEEGENGRTKVLMSFLDTGKVSLQRIALNQFYWDDYQREDVQLLMHNKFFDGITEIDTRKEILYRWAYNHINEGSMKMLSVNLHTNQDLTDEILAIYSNKSTWPDGVFANLSNEMDKLEPANQQKLMEVLKGRKDNLSKEEWKVVKELEKNF